MTVVDVVTMTVQDYRDAVDAAEARCEYWRTAAYRLASQLLSLEAKSDDHDNA